MAKCKACMHELCQIKIESTIIEFNEFPATGESTLSDNPIITAMVMIGIPI